MKTITKIYTLLLLAFCICNLNAQQALEFTISTEKQTYVIGEPIYLEILITNNSNKSVELVYHPDVENHHLMLDISTPGNENNRFFFPLGIDDGEYAPIKLASGQTYGYFAPIHFGAAGWYFTKTGQYKIQALYDYDKDGSLKSNTATISIISNGQFDNVFEEQNEASRELGKYTKWQSGDHLKKGLEMANTLRDNSSSLRNYFLYFEGIRFSKSFKDYTKNQVRPYNAQRSNKMLNEVNMVELPVYLQIQALIAKTKNAIRVENKTAAIKSLSEAKDLKSDFVSLQNFNQQLTNLNEIVLGMN